MQNKNNYPENRKSVYVIITALVCLFVAFSVSVCVYSFTQNNSVMKLQERVDYNEDASFHSLSTATPDEKKCASLLQRESEYYYNNGAVSKEYEEEVVDFFKEKLGFRQECPEGTTDSVLFYDYLASTAGKSLIDVVMHYDYVVEDTYGNIVYSQYNIPVLCEFGRDNYGKWCIYVFTG